jgi:hypothetical protein
MAMGNKIFVAVVVLLWTTTMSWLVVDKILPPFFQGEPPVAGTMRDEPICWDISFRDHPIGFAVSQVVPGALSTTELHSRVILDDVPLQEMAPQWMSSLVGGLGHVRLDTRTSLMLDSLGNFSSFTTKVRMNELPSVVKVSGHVQGSDLLLRFQSGEMKHESHYPIPSSSLLSTELIPEPKLLQIYVGRKWQKEVFSPFRAPNDAMEYIQAEVVNVKRIEYRTLMAAGVSTDDRLRAVLWVADDGVVLRQDLHMMNVTLRFERRDDPKGLALGKKLLDLDRVATLTNPF